jgi:hypothetical protein
MLQSATHALKGGHSEKVVLSCLFHDIGVASFIRCDHGYWGAQMIEPYVEEEVSWAVRMHQALRFFPDPSVGYEYPQMYVKFFGADYKPEPYIVAEYERARNHKWYMSARLITLNDIYSFDPDAKVDLNDFVDIIGRNFKQPKEGLGFDNSASAHVAHADVADAIFVKHNDAGSRSARHREGGDPVLFRRVRGDEPAQFSPRFQGPRFRGDERITGRYGICS